MITENLSTLKIHKLTQVQYDREFEAGRTDPSALYLTPDEEVDLSGYATLEQLNNKADTNHNHDSKYDAKGTANTAANAALESAKSYTNTKIADLASISYVDTALNSKAEKNDLESLQGDIQAINTLVGDKAVSEQIATAVDEIVHPVTSVNGKTGAVQLTASDVGALPASTTIPSIAGLATETYVDGKISGVNILLNNKVDKVSGKGLSTNDYTTTEKDKLHGIAEGANKTIVDSALSSTSTNPVQNKVVNAAISNLNTLVGDVAVSEQISSAFATRSNVVVVNVDGLANTASMSSTEISEIAQNKVIFAVVSGLANKVYSYYGIQYSSGSNGTSSSSSVFVTTTISGTAATADYLYIDDSKNVTHETKTFSGGTQKILVVEVDSTSTASHRASEIYNANLSGIMVFIHDGNTTMPLLHTVDPVNSNTVSVKFAEYNILYGFLFYKTYTVDENKAVTSDTSYFALPSTTENWTFTLEDGSTVTKAVCIG